MHRGHRIQEHSEKVVKFQQQGIPLREGGGEQPLPVFLVYAMSKSVQVRESINLERLLVVKDATRY